MAIQAHCGQGHHPKRHSISRHNENYTPPVTSVSNKFAQLPAELRLRIWSQSVEPRIVLFEDLARKNRSYPLPNVTQLNMEARSETRAGYEPVGKGSYLDLEKDILVCDHKVSDNATPDPFLEELAPRIKRLAFWDCFPDDGRVDGPYHYSVYLSACYRQQNFGKIEFDRFWFPNLEELWIVKVGEVDPAWMVQVDRRAPYEARMRALAKQFRYWVDDNIIEMAPLDLTDAEVRVILREGRCSNEDCHELNRGRSKMVSKVTFLDGPYRAPKMDERRNWVRITPWNVDEEKMARGSSGNTNGNSGGSNNYSNTNNYNTTNTNTNSGNNNYNNYNTTNNNNYSSYIRSNSSKTCVDRMRWVLVERILTFDLRWEGWSDDDDDGWDLKRHRRRPKAEALRG